jgi:putative oxidoreductase
MKTKMARGLRIFLGIFMIGYALNQFLHVFPTGYGEMPESARNFIDGVAIYLPALYVFEMLIGLFLILNKWSAFIQIVIFPLSMAFLIFMFANQDISETWPALVVAAINIFLLLNDWEKYRPLFEQDVEQDNSAD